MNNNFTLDFADEAATLDFAAVLAKVMQPNLIIYLYGDLGAGKTTLVRGLLHAMGHVGKVKSPTYTLVEPYVIESNVKARYNFYHFDLYRFNDDEEWEEAGFRDYFNTESICIIEWPEKAKRLLPTPDFSISFTIKPLANIHALGRSVNITAHSTLGLQCIQSMKVEVIK